jgi:hypothetical protein
MKYLDNPFGTGYGLIDQKNISSNLENNKVEEGDNVIDFLLSVRFALFI